MNLRCSPILAFLLKSLLILVELGVSNVPPTRCYIRAVKEQNVIVCPWARASGASEPKLGNDKCVDGMPSVSASESSWAAGSGRCVSLGLLSIGPTLARPVHLSSGIHVPVDVKIVGSRVDITEIIPEIVRRGQG